VASVIADGIGQQTYFVMIIEVSALFSARLHYTSHPAVAQSLPVPAEGSDPASAAVATSPNPQGDDLCGPAPASGPLRETELWGAAHCIEGPEMDWAAMGSAEGSADIFELLEHNAAFSSARLDEVP
jgi:hypothetical protein